MDLANIEGREREITVNAFSTVFFHEVEISVLSSCIGLQLRLCKPYFGRRALEALPWKYEKQEHSLL